MVKLLIDLLDFLRTCAPLLTSLFVLTLLCILLSKSIKKYSKVYYIILAIPFVLVAVPSIGRMFGTETTGFTGIPLLGEIIRDYIHMGTFGHPLLIIIMYMGALDPKVPYVGSLLKIRKELSIIVGFPVLAHSLIRVIHNLPGSLRFFTNHTEYMSNTKVASELGAGISSFSFVLGIVMVVIFIPLWITSFGPVHKRMGNVKWKKLQKWSYVLYATLFIHAMGIQVGGMLNPREGRSGSRPATETTVVQETTRGGNKDAQSTVNEEKGRRNAGDRPEAAGKSGEQRKVSGAGEKTGQTGTVTKQTGGGRTPTKGFADIKVSPQAKRYIHIISLLLIYGSYLYLRLRKAKKDRMKRRERITTA
jgi:Predicted membrane protein